MATKKRPKYILVIMWRTEGEQSLAFSSKAEAEHHIKLISASSEAHKIVKFEVIEQK